MPRPPKSSRAPLSAEAVDLWVQILTVSEAIVKQAPWNWISAASVLGVEDPVSCETDWCSVMGQGGETFGVAIYPGVEGATAFARLLDHGPDEFDAIFQQTAWVLTYNSRDMLAPDMAAILKQLDRKYRGANAWPEILRHQPGYFPLPPTDAIALRRILHTLERVHSMCAKAQQQPQWDQGDEQGRHWIAVDGSHGDTQFFARHFPEAAPVVLPELIQNEVAEARAKTAKTAAAHTWAVDWFPGNSVIDGPEANGRPYFIIHPLIADAQNGLVLSTNISQLATIHQDIANLLVSCCVQHGRPTTILVRRPEAVTVLSPLARRLGITLRRHDQVVEITRHFREFMESFGGMGR